MRAAAPIIRRFWPVHSTCPRWSDSTTPAGALSRCNALRSADPKLAGSWIAEGEGGSRQGLRGLRLSLTRPELLRTQVRALLRASRHGSLRIMFPFVSGVEQLREARRIVTEAAADLSA